MRNTAPQSVPQQPGESPIRAVTVRAVLLGLVLLPFNALWIVYLERVDGTTFDTTTSLFFTPVFFLTLLTLLNTAVRRFFPRLALHRAELLLIYSMVALGTAMGALDFLSCLFGIIGHGAHFATPGNNWEIFQPLLPKWLAVVDREALKPYYAGHSSFYSPQYLRAWIPPLAFWTLFILLLIYIMACLNTLIRAVWTERERLPFPITQLPLAITDENAPLTRDRYFWLGFGFAAIYTIGNIAHNLFPAFPTFTFNGFNAGEWFVERPWNSVGYHAGGWLPLAIFPFIVGMGYLLPTDLLFSCWFFFLVAQAQQVVTAALGAQTDGNAKYPYLESQAFGGYTSVFVFAILGARSHLFEIWKKVWGEPSTLTDDPNAEMTYRGAALGAFFGFLALIAFSYFAGLPLWVGVLFFLIYFMIAIAVTRMRAELGPPTHDLHFIGPNQTLYNIFGSRALGEQALTTLTLYYWFNRAYRAHPMPQMLEGVYMSRRTGASSRGMVAVLLLAAFVGVVSFCWVTLDTGYRLGAAAQMRSWMNTGSGNEAFNRLMNWLGSSANPDRREAGGMVAGFLVASGITLLRQTIHGFPFHALGYAISGGWSMLWCWPSLLVAWAIKICILRYGGLRAFRIGLPFFYGLILGEFLLAGAWTVVCLANEIPLYSFWSG